MTYDEERHALELWFAAFDPAVDVQMTDDAVFIRSVRPNRTSEVVRSGRTGDLYQDLNNGLSQLVEQMS